MSTVRQLTTDLHGRSIGHTEPYTRPVRSYNPRAVSPELSAKPMCNPDGSRIRTRQCALRIESTDPGSFWRLGKCMFRYARDGKR